MTVELTWDQALAWRVDRHHLAARRRATDPVALVGELGGVQAQVLPSAKQVIGIRSDATPEMVERLLWTERRLVKTWAMRGTLHLLPSDELDLWAAVLRTRETRITPGWEKYHGVTGAELHAITDAVPGALDDEPITRDELAGRIAARLRQPRLAEVLRSGWAAVLKPAANQGLLVQGPPVGGNVTFVDPSRWLGRPITAADPHASMATVVDRFLDVNGPATHEDLARWLGVQPKQARQIIGEHADRVEAVSVDGPKAWMTARGAAAAGAVRPKRSVYLLPGFDPYVLAPISHRRHTIPDGRIDEVSRRAGWISAVLLVDGRIAGTWTTEPAGTEGGPATVTVTPFVELRDDVADAAARHLATRYRHLLGPATLVVG
ncbi:MAG: winged helix DNA-binding domain-containing protein [Acidimicrobiales bacterium]